MNGKHLLFAAWAVAILLPAHAAAMGPGAPAPGEASGKSSKAYQMGEEAVKQKQWEKAAELFQKAIAEDPMNPDAHNMYGYSLRQLGRYKEAIAAYDTALKLKPDYAEALEYRGAAHLKAGNKDAALQDYRTLVRMKSPLAEDLKKELVAGGVNVL